MPNWNIEALKMCPGHEIVASDDGIDAVLYQNEPYKGNPTRAFAYLGVPDTGEASVPGMVLVHGGGGAAFKHWVKMWNDRGYAAIAMDLIGMDGDGQRLPDGGPRLEHEDIFDTALPWEDYWTYHSVARVIRAHSLLASQPRVDAARTGITGISWGGYLTCIVAGLDGRFGCAVPVYGCGFLQESSAEGWMEIFDAMAPQDRRTWHDLCDPSVYLPGATMPMLFVCGTNDFAYHLDSYKKSYSLVKSPLTVCVKHEMDHGHEPGWAPAEIQMFADHFFRGAPALPRIGRAGCEGGTVRATFTSDCPVEHGYLVYTKDTGVWPERKWHKEPATLGDGEVCAPLPQAATACFLAVEDDRGGYVSTPHEEGTEALRH